MTIIGKDVIESLTLGMYEDSRFIFREYIQNSADQIDKAIKSGLFSNMQDGVIEIDINKSSQTISFYDNATGIENSKVEPILKNIAQSTKNRATDKGFRGIGRLGGLAYTDKLIFETSFKGESTKSILIWNAKKLKEIINNRTTKEEATDVIDSITEFSTEECKTENHYFKVILEGVSNETLLDKDEIRQYLTMVAPVPYNNGFLYKAEIKDKANELECIIDEYKIFVNHDQVFKAYTTSIYESHNHNKKKIDEIYDIETYEIRNSKNKLLAWGWYSLSTFTKVIPSVNYARGIRLRKGNIQVGLEDVLTKLFKENRGTNYFFGEVYAISSELIPNARRDYFLDNTHLQDFERRIKEKFSGLHKLYHLSSEIRSPKKKLDDSEKFLTEFKKKSDIGFSDKAEQEKYQTKLEKIKNNYIETQNTLDKIRKKCNSKTEEKLYQKIVGDDRANNIDTFNLAKDNDKTKYIADDISKLNRKDKKLVSKIFGIIDTVLTPDLSDLLKQKIKEGLQ